jgi:hypothetical protein
MTVKWYKYPDVKPDWNWTHANAVEKIRHHSYPVLVTNHRQIAVAFAEFTQKGKFYMFGLYHKEMRITHWAYIEELELPHKPVERDEE